MSSFDSSENIIKLFGMSNELIEADLDRIEKDYQIDLGRFHRKGSDKDERYYPQFDKSVREEAAKMADHYEFSILLKKLSAS